MIKRLFTTAIALAALAMPLSVAPASAKDPLAKDVFGAARGPTAGKAAAIGFYSKGCIAGAVALPESGPSWQAMRLSRNRNWGHPEMIDFLIGLSRAAQKAGWNGLYIGDIGQPRGGPASSGHASHQMGLDADIWLMAPPSLKLTPTQRENMSAVSVVNKAGTQLTEYWNPGTMAIIRAAASDPRVERIFVDPVVKVAMCEQEQGNRAYLRKIRPINAHNYHFHVRLACPAGSVCQKQDPPPAGDGCAEAGEWILNRIDPSRVKPVPPDPNYRHPRTYRMSEMPQQCQPVAAAR